MTPRAWAYGLLFAAGAALGVALWLLLAAQTVGVEAWHDSAVPQSAFVAVTPPTRAAALSPAAYTSNAAGRLAPLPSLAPASRPSLGVAASTAGNLDPNQVSDRVLARANEAPYGSPAIPGGALRPASPTSRAGVTEPSAGIMGTASWFDSPADVSAAGQALRAAIGPDWRGTVVRVCAETRCVRTVLGDWCLCVVGDSERVVDLDWRSFAALAPLSAGLVKVEVSW